MYNFFFQNFQDASFSKLSRHIETAKPSGGRFSLARAEWPRTVTSQALCGRVEGEAHDTITNKAGTARWIAQSFQRARSRERNGGECPPLCVRRNKRPRKTLLLRISNGCVFQRCTTADKGVGDDEEEEEEMQLTELHLSNALIHDKW